MKPLAINDPVTVLDETGKLLVHARWGEPHRGYVATLGVHRVYRHGMAGRISAGDVKLADEGVTWCRGHMSDKDDEGKALLVAGALAPSGPRGAVGPGPCPIGPQGPVGVAGAR